ncbi:hypothetical protein CHH59_12635 [Shouchella clausii]|uniref:hypothetical protein n=1 Tax=Shouchella clausii TaxID=79880 RepID=UPI000BA7600D|nr:hypothetical protein [Shouchella clausii]PAF13689.1 hypothetical protein CHH59_12635 [Shouchella clausii]
MKMSVVQKDYVKAVKRLSLKVVTGEATVKEVLINVPIFTEKFKADQMPEEVQEVHMNLYEKDYETNYGIPYATVLWLGEGSFRKIKTFTYDEEQYGYYYKWMSIAKSVNESSLDDVKDSEDFSNDFNEIHTYAENQLMNLNESVSILHNGNATVKNFRDRVNNQRNDLDKLLFSMEDLGVPTFENGVQQENLKELNNLVSSMHNIAVLCSNDVYSDKSLIRLVNKYIYDANEANRNIVK